MKYLHQNHRKRMRERFIATDGAGFVDHELLELLLFSAIPRINTNPIAHNLLSDNGSISEVLSADIDTLKETKGIGNSSARLISLMSETCKRYRKSSGNKVRFSSHEELTDYICKMLSGCTESLCMIISLNSNMELVHSETIPLTDLLYSKDSTKKLYTIFLKDTDNRFISVICRPDRLPLPSSGDHKITKEICEIANALKIEYLDSMIYGRSKIFSMRSEGAFGFPKIGSNE